MLKLKNVLQKAGSKQADLAKALNVSQATVAQIVNHGEWPKSLDAADLHERIRAFLVMESARLFGLRDKESLPVAAAVEALHAYSLVHDDLPCMDDDALRRGRPTVHVQFDEATAMLDPSGRREVLDTVHRLNRERGITVVHITHHMSEAEDADRVIVMNDGVVAMDGAPREIFSRVEELQALGLAAPDTVELLRRLNRHGMNLPLTAITVDECARAIFQALHGAEGK